MAAASALLHSNAAAALEVRGLTVRIHGQAGSFPVVRDMEFSVDPGKTLAIVGESGCGKTMTALSLLGLQPPAARIEAGNVRVAGVNMLGLARGALEDMRGNRISMIFQEPLTSLNPVMMIGEQIAEGLRRHRGLTRRAAMDRAVEMLALVRIPEPERRVRDYPHQLSGGMRQRAMIALALACDPAVLVADEPTTALDVTIQAQVLGLIREMQHTLGVALVLITHDLGVVAGMADEVIVMYAGRRVEVAPVVALFDQPRHPYTRALMRATPHLADPASGDHPLQEISGIVPALWNLPPGCAFAARCPLAMDRCRTSEPPLEQKVPGHFAACWVDADAA